MGNVCNNLSGNQQVIGELDPINSTFVELNYHIQVNQQHIHLLQKIRLRFDAIDFKISPNKKWYQSARYNLYMYGNVNKDRPFGDCFFYMKNQNKGTPLIITTNVNEHYVFSNKTLIIYPQKIMYFGSIKNNIATLPRAQGKGIMVSSQFTFQGQFKNGLPHGYGVFRSKFEQFIGTFKNGQAFGECIQKTSKGIFIGRIQQNGQKVGIQINPQNKVTQIKGINNLEMSMSLKQYLNQ